MIVMYVSNVILVASAGVVLHNLCEMFNDNCLLDWTATHLYSSQ